MAKRIYSETVKKWAKGIGISGVTLVGLIFMYLIAVGAISNVSYSGDSVCAGTEADPCYAYINFTAEEDIFIYPTDYDPWGRDTLFNFDPNVKSWKLQRSWGSGWRNIPLDKACTGTWCGLSSSKDERKFSIAFRKGRDYQIRIVALKNNPYDTIKWGAFSGVDEIDPSWFGTESPIGYEFLDDGAVVHIWNNATVSDYYFDKDSGIQLTNHYEDYWTRNIFCLGYYNNDEWHKIKCADELTEFNKSIETDNETYVNATLYKDIEYQGYNMRLGVRYHLGLNDDSLSISVYGKNIGGNNIPFKLGFAWKVTDVVIATDEKDHISLNGSEYDLDGTYDLTFRNMTDIHINEETNETIIQARPTLWIRDRLNFLRIDWNENLNYAVKIYGNGNQEDFYVALLVNAGLFDSGVEKSTTFQWVDAEYDIIGLSSYYASFSTYALNSVESIFVDGDYLYTSSSSYDTVSIMNISNKSEIIGLSAYKNSIGEYSLDDVRSIFVQGDYLYTSSGADDYVSIFDISNKSEIVPTCSYTDADGEYSVDGIREIFVDGDYLYTTSRSDYYVSIMNISNKSEIVPVSTYYGASADFDLRYVESIFVQGDYLYTSSSGNDWVSIMDISNKSEIVGLSEYQDQSGYYSVDGVTSIFVDGDYLYTSSSIDGCVSIMDVSNKNVIAESASYCDTSGEYSLNGVDSIFVQGDYLFASASTTNYVSIFDISNKSEIVPTYSYTDADGEYSVDGVRSIFVQGDYLYTSSYDDKYVSIMELTEPIDDASPTYSLNQTNTTIAGVSTLFSILYDDDTALESAGQYIFSTNNTGVWTNESAVNFTATPNWANVTKTLNSTVGISIGYRWYADDNAGNINNTEIFVLTTTSTPSDSCTYTSGNWEIDCNDNCTISSNVAMGGNDLVFSNTGTFHMSANITNYGNINLSSGCSIIMDDNTFLIS